MNPEHTSSLAYRRSQGEISTSPVKASHAQTHTHTHKTYVPENLAHKIQHVEASQASQARFTKNVSNKYCIQYFHECHDPCQCTSFYAHCRFGFQVLKCLGLVCERAGRLRAVCLVPGSIYLATRNTWSYTNWMMTARDTGQLCGK